MYFLFCLLHFRPQLALAPILCVCFRITRELVGIIIHYRRPLCLRNRFPPVFVAVKNDPRSRISRKFWPSVYKQLTHRILCGHCSGLPQSGISTTVAESIALMPSDLQAMFWANIGLIGGNTKLPGFPQRLCVLSTIPSLCLRIFSKQWPVVNVTRSTF